MNVDIPEADDVQITETSTAAHLRSDRPDHPGVNQGTTKGTQTKGIIKCGDGGNIIIATNFIDLTLVWNNDALPGAGDTPRVILEDSATKMTSLARINWKAENLLANAMTCFKLRLKNEQMPQLLNNVKDAIVNECHRGRLQTLVQDLFDKFAIRLFGLNEESLVFILEHPSVDDAKLTLSLQNRRDEIKDILYKFLPDWVKMHATWSVVRYILTPSDVGPSYGYADNTKVPLSARVPETQVGCFAQASDSESDVDEYDTASEGEEESVPSDSTLRTTSTLHGKTRTTGSMPQQHLHNLPGLSPVTRVQATSHRRSDDSSGAQIIPSTHKAGDTDEESLPGQSSPTVPHQLSVTPFAPHSVASQLSSTPSSTPVSYTDVGTERMCEEPVRHPRQATPFGPSSSSLSSGSPTLQSQHPLQSSARLPLHQQRDGQRQQSPIQRRTPQGRQLPQPSADLMIAHAGDQHPQPDITQSLSSQSGSLGPQNTERLPKQSATQSYAPGTSRKLVTDHRPSFLKIATSGSVRAVGERPGQREKQDQSKLLIATEKAEPLKKSPPSPLPSAATHDDAPAEDTSDAQKTIVIRGLDSSVNVETVLFYFENPRSGGGPVEFVSVDQTTGVVYVTFEDPQDAANVVTRKHKLSGRNLELSLQKLMRDSVVLSNLPDFDSEDNLIMFVENRTKRAVKSIVFGHQGDVALVTFNSSVDLKDTQKTLTATPFMGHTLDVQCVPMSDVILVRDLPPGWSPNGIELYFDNERRSGVSGVVNVESCDEEEYCLVAFDDPEAAATAVRRSHTIDKQDVSVSLYHELLGPTGGQTERALQIPEPIHLSSDDSRKVSLSLQIPAMKEEILSMLQQHHAALDTEQATGETFISCQITQDTPNARLLLKTWSEDVEKAVGQALEKITVAEVNVSKEEFSEAEIELKQMADQAGSGISAIFDEQELKVYIIFYAVERQKVADDMKLLIDGTKKRLDRAKQEKRETTNIGKQETAMLQKRKVERSVLERHPQLEVNYDPGAGNIMLKGLVGEIAEMRMKIDDEKRKITFLEHKFQSPLKKQLFSSHEAKRILKEACLQEDPEGQVETTPDGFAVWSFDADKASRMLHAAGKTVREKEIPLRPEHKEAVELDDFCLLLASLLEKRKGVLVVKRENEAHRVVGVGPDFDRDVKEIEDFLEENCIQQKAFDMPPEDHTLFHSFLQGQSLLDENRLEYNPQQSRLEVTMSRKDLKAAEQIINAFKKMLVSKTVQFTEPSFSRYIRSNEGKFKMRAIETEGRCKITGIADADMLQMVPLHPKQDSSGAKAEDRQRTRREFHGPKGSEAAESQPLLVAPLYPRIFFTRMSDITKEEHHILVNSSNKELDLTKGQVSSALLEVGGPRIQVECEEKYPDGIDFGDLAVTGPGRTKEDSEKDGKPRLDCLYLFHCCLPEAKDPETMKNVVKEAVKKCLEEAETVIEEGKSIGFPALGTGTLKYPAELVAETMFRAVMEYGNEHPATTISDVYFILHKKDTDLAKVFAAEEKKYQLRRAEKGKRHAHDEKSYFWMTDQKPCGIEKYAYFEETKGNVTMTMTALSEADIDAATADLLAGYKEQIIEVPYEKERLDLWDQSYIHQTVATCRAAHVDVTFNFSLGTLTVRGHRDDVHVNLLHNLFREAEDDLHERENAHLASWQVQWNWVEVELLENKLKPYDELNNYRIEKAYRAQASNAIIFDKNKTAFQINFETMTEVPELIGPPGSTGDTGDALKVVRQDVLTELAMDSPPPENWNPMKEHLDVIKLSPTSAEYKSVARDFMATISSDVSSDTSVAQASQLVQILSIQRVQNLTVYKQYMALKKQMKAKFRQDTMVEKRPLWHGTREDVVDSVIKYGFNRSYCQRSKYGSAVYFAKTAKYSSAEKYAKKNAKGERNMFYCKVLVGRAVEGKDGMRFLPKPGSDDDYDCAVDDVDDPKIFVVFKDAQAYPEYRIVFKDI